MPITIPSRDLTIERKRDVREFTLNAGIANAKHLGLCVSSEELSVRDLNPEDLGKRSWATPEVKADIFTPWIDGIISNTVLCIYKVLQLSAAPTTCTLRFQRNGTVIGLHELENCYSGLPIMQAFWETAMSKEAKEVMDRLLGRDDIEVSPDFGSPMEAYFSEPHIFNLQDYIHIDVKSRTDSPGDYLVLGGYALERRGVTVA